jgi:hypothetical protein
MKNLRLSHRLSPVLLVFAACSGNDKSSPDAKIINNPDADIDAAPSHLLKVKLSNPPADLPAAGVAIAYQDGDGAWRAASAPIAGVISIPLSNNKFGVALGCVDPSDPTSPDATIVYSTFIESPEVALSLGSCRSSSVATSAINGTATTTALTRNVIAFGFNQTAATTTANVTTKSYTRATNPKTADLVTLRQDPTTKVVDKFAIERDVVVSTSPLIKDLNFNAMSAPESVAQPVPVAATGSQFFIIYETPTTLVFSLDSTPPYAVTAPPAAQRKAGDSVDVFLSADSSTGTVSVESVFAAPQAVTVGPNLLAPITAAVTSKPNVLSITWTALAGAAYSVDFSGDCGATCFSFLSATYSKQWLAGASMVTSPDFSTVVGWNPTLVIDPLKTSGAMNAEIDVGNYPDIGSTVTIYSQAFDLRPPFRKTTPSSIPPQRRFCSIARFEATMEPCLVVSVQ